MCHTCGKVGELELYREGFTGRSAGGGGDWFFVVLGLVEPTPVDECSEWSGSL